MDAPWHAVLVRPSDTIEEVLRVLDAGALRIAMVVAENGRLLGVVTDGDMRRALLRHIGQNQPVTEIMNPRPLVARKGTSREVLRTLMEANVLLHIPLVDEAGRLTGLETFHDLLQTPRRDNWVFLMAGGYGTRLRPMTDQCPKPLLPVGGKPLLESILESFVAAGFHRFCISVHYLADHIKTHFGNGERWGVTIRYVEEATPLGTGGALGLLPDIDGRPVLMMNGDVLTRLDFTALLDFHEAQDAALTMCVREYDMQVPFGVVEGDNSRVVSIVEKPIRRFFVNAGVYTLSPAVIDGIRPPRRMDMPDLVQGLIDDGRRVAMFPIHEYWLDVGRPEDFERAQVDIRAS